MGKVNVHKGFRSENIYTIHNIQFGRLGHIWEDNIKIFLKEIGRNVDWNDLAHNRDK